VENKKRRFQRGKRWKAAVAVQGDGRITTGGGVSGVVINMSKHLRILLLTEVIIRVDRTGIYTIQRDQMVGYYVYALSFVYRVILQVCSSLLVLNVFIQNLIFGILSYVCLPYDHISKHSDLYASYVVVIAVPGDSTFIYPARTILLSPFLQ